MPSPPALCSRTCRTRPIEPGAPIERISLELSRRCNLKCHYCYTRASANQQGGLSDADLQGIVAQAVALGARLISIVAGGEPLLRPSMTRDKDSLVDYANGLGCYCYLYTNCTLLDATTAEFLFLRDVSIVGKLNSLNDRIQDELVGVPGSSRLIRRGIDALLDGGFASSGPSRLAIESIICPKNYEEIPDLWHWMRARNIIPELEIPTLHGRALEHMHEIAFPAAEASQKYEVLFRELARIDRDHYGFEWEPHPPFPGAICRLFENNCYINAEGRVQPCAGVDCTLGQLEVVSRAQRGASLADILRLPAFKALRRVRELVQSPCRECDLINECYGCRGAAFQATGDMFAADPVCWKHAPATPSRRSLPLSPTAPSCPTSR